MGLQISDSSIEVIQQLVHSAFNANATLDRVKTVLNAELACPILSNIVHMRAHNYAVEIGDTIGDIIEDRNISVNYGGIERHIEQYTTPLSAIEKVFDTIMLYQIELNRAYEIIIENKDFHILAEIEDVIETHNEYVKKIILWKDIVEKYGSDPMMDVAMKEYA